LQSWLHTWRPTWNPVLFAEQGYVVVMPNITGKFCCDLGQVTGGLVIRRAKIELIKIVSKEYIESLKRNYLKSD
jgi:hypothetical protein